MAVGATHLYIGHVMRPWPALQLLREQGGDHDGSK